MSTQTEIAGRYVVERQLGRGGMGVVLLARDTELERPVAVKLLDQSLAADPVLRQRFEREARAAARLSHPNLVRVYDARADGDPAYIVMEYVAGETLGERLQRRGSLPPAEVVEIGLQACAGLAVVHAAGLVHRDVKPQNLLLSENGTLKLTDFGIAWAADASSLTQVGTVLGTAGYIAPEQAAGEPVTAAADVYALGAVLYEALTGVPPRQFASIVEVVQRRGEPFAPVRAVARATPVELEAAVMRCLDPDPRLRPQDGAALLRELAPLSPDAPTRHAPVRAPQPFAPPAPRMPYPVRRTRPRLGALLLLLAAVAAFVSILVWASARGNGMTKPAPPVAPVPHGQTAQVEARNLARWLRAHAAR
ncbi:MAG: eukaryotic-like serine/threonine-protein kinase [Gaiellaceae bacterium]|nr:eukaryotic-like serine/threonine-protein kinase [Gaiellaceae bacterium]